MSDLEIPIRELHARTGHYVRKAAAQGRILVTHRGQPMAELRPLSGEAGPAEGATWKDREILPAFAAVMNEPVGGTDSTLAVAEDRERG
ncbi:MAG: type II toxin-antitoxin system prevent-host-death family antitoxin [Opitutales bacterium]|nr:type II toxin-antitoxin system prevent-host-death family antitoxin [Opitutales bacterium]